MEILETMSSIRYPLVLGLASALALSTLLTGFPVAAAQKSSSPSVKAPASSETVRPSGGAARVMGMNSETADANANPANGSPRSRGEYLANDLAMCVQCHSPRDARGELIPDRHFQGAPIPVKSPYSGAPRWAFTAPNLRRLPGYTEEQFLEFMTTGVRPNGTHARSPMPPFRMDSQDARAVYDYLMSL